MIDFIDVSIHFTGTPLFDSARFRVNKSDRIALVGSNGTGKSTILKMIAGLEEPSSGNIAKQKNIRIGYLPQEHLVTSSLSVFNEVKTSLTLYNEIELKEKHLHLILKDETLSPDEHDKALNELGIVNDQKEKIDFYSTDSNIEKVLEGLGFHESSFTIPVNTFSGGWQMRIELAKILLNDNDIILLDEPTNHLDIDSLQWLINFLMNFKGSILLVSHDRYFVNKMTNKTLEIFNRKLTLFNGNYDAYLKFKDERDNQLLNDFSNQEKKRKQTLQFIERFRYKATKAKQVQSRIKQLEKLQKFDLPQFESNISIRFPEPPRSGVIPIEIESLSKSYGENKVFEKFDLRIERGEKIAFLGPNGAGKTTLAKIIAGKTDIDSGIIKFGHNTVTSYYSQEVADDLELESDIIDNLMEGSSDSSPQRLRTILGSFLFTDDDVFKKVKVLSGGEKSRVALAKILLTKANLIILDEPTNHLDYQSKEVLQEALINSSAAIIIVSHDIDFLTPIVDKVLEIRKLNTSYFHGGIDYYLHKKSNFDESEIIEVEKKLKVSRKQQKRIEAEKRRFKSEATKQLSKTVNELEHEIEELEAQKLKIENDLGDVTIYSDPEKAAERNKEYEEIKSKLIEIEHLWSEKSEKLESILKEYSE